MKDWRSCDAVECHPDMASGAWVFPGTRVPVSALFENFKDSASIEQFLEWFPGIERAIYLMRKYFSLLLILISIFQKNPALAQSSIELHYVASFFHGDYLELASEVVVHDPKTQRLFVVNAQNVRVDVLDIRTPIVPQLFTSISASQFGGGVNSVDVCDGVVAVAIEDTNKQAPGTVGFYDTNGKFLRAVKVGPMPDMLKFSPDGRWLLTADEGEPNQDYTIDPHGSVSIIDLSGGVTNLTQKHVRTVDFSEFDTKPFDPRIRVFGPNATPAQDFEPEYIAISPDSRTAWIILQENNALAILDIIAGKFSKLVSLGFKDHNIKGNGLDASNSDQEPDIKTWPVLGMYQPDAIVPYQAKGKTFLLTANEGDPRRYAAFNEEVRVEDVVLETAAFKKIGKLQKGKNLGRLKVSKANGDIDGDGDYDELYVFGARSFAIWTADGELVYDSGDDFERITAIAFPKQFNSDNEKNGSFDSRSDDRGPEPEGLALARLDGRTYVFIGLERIGGIMVYDITDPNAPNFVQYINNRNFYGNAYEGTAGDLGPEGLKFIGANDSPAGKPLLIVANEVSGTTSIYAIEKIGAESPADPKSIPRQYSQRSGPGAAIRFSLLQPAYVKIEVVNKKGKPVSIAADRYFPAGSHRIGFRPKNRYKRNYFCRIIVNGIVQQVRKVRFE